MAPVLRTAAGPVSYAVSGPSDSERRDIVLVHGWCCDRSTLDPVREHLEPRHRVLAIDLRGHGASLEWDDDGSTGVGCGRRGDQDAMVPEALREVRIEDYAQDVLQACREARLLRPVAIGHSMGGLVALAAVRALDPSPAAHPGAAVLLDPAGIANANVKEFWQRRAQEVARDHDGSWRRDFAATLWVPAPSGSVPSPERARVVELMAGTPAAVAAAACRAMARFDGAEALRHVGGPLLVLHGASVERGLADHLPDPALLTTGQTVGAGHFLQLEVPEQVLPMIDRWLAVTGLR